MATFHFELVSPEALLISAEVEEVTLPGAEGVDPMAVYSTYFLTSSVGCHLTSRLVIVLFADGMVGNGTG